MTKRKRKRVCTITFDEHDNAVLRAKGFFGKAKSEIVSKLQDATLTITPEHDYHNYGTYHGVESRIVTASKLTITCTGRVAPEPVKEPKKSAAERAWEKWRSTEGINRFDPGDDYMAHETFLLGWKRGRK